MITLLIIIILGLSIATTIQFLLLANDGTVNNAFKERLEGCELINDAQSKAQDEATRRLHVIEQRLNAMQNGTNDALTALQTQLDVVHTKSTKPVTRRKKRK